MDYAKMERERGITINSAAITFQWEGFTFNLFRIHMGPLNSLYAWTLAFLLVIYL
jgi:hypothetical protein